MGRTLYHSVDDIFCKYERSDSVCDITVLDSDAEIE
jgi:hypothetical protein